MKNEEKEYYTIRDFKKMYCPIVPQDKPYYTPKHCFHLQILYGLSCALDNVVNYIDRMDKWISPDFLEVWGDEYEKLKESLGEFSSGLNEYIAIANEFDYECE